ncbi:hypothetical protein MtrunA17_Chr2g0304081 [Medicago truncatula]|uniref:Transmembrane protein n=1 Tax=Medicago truncatula TaxID=3880 RepID=A0A396J9E8_MEDTR|nr:hypothetical protein MtrunA17_Chr2g0304081 [Medicago truncatula]
MMDFIVLHNRLIIHFFVIYLAGYGKIDNFKCKFRFIVWFIFGPTDHAKDMPLVCQLMNFCKDHANLCPMQVMEVKKELKDKF